MAIGDPTLVGWLTFFVYMAVVYCCYRQYVITKLEHADPYFWLVIALFLLLMGLNKQLDLQTVFETTMKELAIAHGWYAQRKLLQSVFVVMLGIGLCLLLVVLRGVLAASCRRHQAVCWGVFLLCVFIVLRAAAFNHLSFLNTQTLGVNAHVVLELTALGLIFYGTYFNRYHGFNHTHGQSTRTPTKSYALCAATGDDVYCPHCQQQAQAKAVHGRQFKCKGCAASYTVRIG